MPTCYTLIGPPGCGKSTWRATNAPILDNAAVISTDDLVEEQARAEGKTYSEVFSEIDYEGLIRKCRVMVSEAVMRGRDLILDQTNYTVGRRNKFRPNIPPYYEHVGVLFEYDRDELLTRVKARESENGKHIPAFVIDNMIEKFEPIKKGEFSRVIVVKRGADSDSPE